jgi:predicted lipoprotein
MVDYLCVFVERWRWLVERIPVVIITEHELDVTPSEVEQKVTTKAKVLQKPTSSISWWSRETCSLGTNALVAVHALRCICKTGYHEFEP